ncbi:jg17639 [Pararge aegeria aegeria]|uniref:Jg17639 protein n=1 Tax=Pararge aegeria aegeria TaxID=348720 RepID=A0A8S4R5Y6_9NEOP|nr:jg17639 [Pararge aegeria aegeria]
MTNDIKPAVKIGNDELEYVDQYIYFGKQIEFNRYRNDQEIEKRVKNTWSSGPPGKPYRGRPCTRWYDYMKKIGGPQWIKLHQDRKRWQALEEAFTGESSWNPDT